MGKLIIMKLTYLFILFSSIICNSQTIKGVVKNSYSKEPLEFTNVFIKRSTYGTFTDTLGYFEIDAFDFADSLYFSRIGFMTQKVKVSDLKIHETNEILLMEMTETLKEIIISNKKREYSNAKRIKNKSESNEINYFSFQFGTEHCVYFANEIKRQGKIESFSIDLKQVKDGNKECKECKVDYITDFNIKFYEFDEKTKKPGIEIFSEPILIETENKTYNFIVDLNKYNILFPENGVCIGIEVINRKYKNPKLAGAFTAPSINFQRIRKPSNNESWIRYRNSGNWKFKSYMGHDSRGKFLDRINIDLKVKYVK